MRKDKDVPGWHKGELFKARTRIRGLERIIKKIRTMRYSGPPHGEEIIRILDLCDEAIGKP